MLRFEDGKIMLGGKDLLAQSANLSMAPSLQPERVYGEYDASIAGAKTEFINFAPTQNLKGQLDVSFFISAETFAQGGTPNTIDRMFEIVNGMSEGPINQNMVGRYEFDNMYLKSFGFELSPFQVVRATASYDIYGSLERTIDRRFQKTEVDMPHALKSFGSILASGGSYGEFEILNLKYNIVVDRKAYNNIRGNEHTSVNTSPDGAIPVRVSVESIEKEMSVETNDIIDRLNTYGDQQNLSTPEGLQNSSIGVFLLDMSGNKVANFDVSGKIMNQSISIQEGQNARGSVTIKEIVK